MTVFTVIGNPDPNNPFLDNRGGGGDDTYTVGGAFVSGAAQFAAITDPTATIELVPGVEITSSEVQNDSLTLTFSNGSQLTVLQTAQIADGANANAVPPVVDDDLQSFEEYSIDELGVDPTTLPDGEPATGTGSTAGDDDGGGGNGDSEGFNIAADAAVVEEGDTGQVEDATFTVTRGDTNGTAQVDFAVDFGASDADADDFAQAQGTVTFADGESSAEATVRVSGDGEVELDEDFTVALSNPIGDILGDTTSATGTIENDDTPTLSINDVSVEEGDNGITPFAFTITLTDPDGVSRPALQDVTVDVETVADTATAGSDFIQPASQPVSLVIPVGSATTTFTIDGLTDVEPEGDETFNLELSNPSNAIIADGAAVGTIAEDDALQVSIEDVEIQEMDAGSSPTARFEINLSRTLTNSETVTVDFASADGTAEAIGPGTGDYESVSGTLTFQAGDQNQTVAVDINGDEQAEGTSEQFFLNLSNPQLNGQSEGITLSDDQGVATILEDDIPEITITEVAANEGDAGTAEITVQVQLERSAPDTILVDFATFVPDLSEATSEPSVNPATIAESDDFFATSGTVVFDPGTSTATFTVEFSGDQLLEPSEIINVALFNPRDESERVFPNPEEGFANPRNLIIVNGEIVGSTGFDEDNLTIEQDDGQVVDIDTINDAQIVGTTTTIEITGDDGVIGSEGDDLALSPDGDNSAGNGQLPSDNDDFIKGLAGNDSVIAGAGDDTIEADAGDDTVQGGEGDDSIEGGDGDDSTEDLSERIEPIEIDREININEVKPLWGYGEEWEQPNITGLEGGNGEDTIRGGNGDDLIRGGDEDDLLEGGDGNDIFFYSKEFPEVSSRRVKTLEEPQTGEGDFDNIEGGDTILDFEPGSDQIVLNIGGGLFSRAGGFGGRDIPLWGKDLAWGSEFGPPGLLVLTDLIAPTGIGQGINVASVNTFIGGTLQADNLFRFPSLDDFKESITNVAVGLVPNATHAAFVLTTGSSQLFAVGIRGDDDDGFLPLDLNGGPHGGDFDSPLASAGFLTFTPLSLGNASTITIAKLNGITSNIGGDISLLGLGDIFIT